MKRFAWETFRSLGDAPLYGDERDGQDGRAAPQRRACC
jgi:hypothetical protein